MIGDSGVGVGETVRLSSGFLDVSTMLTTADISPAGVGLELAMADGVPGAAEAECFAELQSEDALECLTEPLPELSINVDLGE